MHLLQNYLCNGGTLEELKAKYAIDATRHKLYPNLVLLKYNQVESPFAEPLVRSARGIILDEADHWRVICLRFDKFFNYGEGHAASIDWKTARVQEKVDGSLVTLYFYDNKWHVATSGSPEASGQVGEWKFTFADLFWQTFNEMGLKVPAYNTELCPSFELTSKFNRVVVPHDKSKLTLIGLFLRDQLIEIPLDSDDFVNVPDLCTYPIVKSFKLSSFDEITTSFAKIDPLSQEGYVVTSCMSDGTVNRNKCKHPGYVALHHLKDSWGPRRIVEIIRAGEVAEFCAYFPEYADQFNDTKVRYEQLVQNLNDTYDELKHISVQKDFALAVQAQKCLVPSALYSLRAGKSDSIKQHLANLPIQSLMKVLGLKDDK